VRRALVRGVVGRLELERRVLDLEVRREARVEGVEGLVDAHLAEDVALDDTVAPLVICHACTSWAETTPAVSVMCARTAARSMSPGAEPNSTRPASSSSDHARGTIMAAMISEPTESAWSKPVVSTTTDATTTAAEPSRSPSTSR
jgi:hypothetical protein